MDEIRIKEDILQVISSIRDNSSSKDLIREMTTGLKEVNIYKGVQLLTDFTRKGDASLGEEASRKSGIDYFSRIISAYLKPFADNILVEYSLISSTLDPKNPDKLQCCAFAKGDKYFKECIDEYYTQCIDNTEVQKTISIYQHPNFLYDIPQTNKPESYIGKDIYHVNDNTETEIITNGRGLTVSIKQVKAKEGCDDDDNYIIVDKNPGHFKDYNGTFMQAFSLNRHFKEMLLDAKNFKVSDGYRLVDIQNCLHSYCHRNISRNDNRLKFSTVKANSSMYISFPVYGTVDSNQLNQYKISDNALQGIGACFMYIEPKDDSILQNPETREAVKVVLSYIADMVSDAIRFISSNYMFNLGLQLQENARKEAIRSAKAAIMSRNMSHNLGSHVMSYLKQKLGSITSILNDDKVLFNIFDKDKEPNTAIDNIQLPFLVGTGRFIGYLQERQDYIATIATDYIPYGAPVNLKDAIYDELNPDLRHKRHNVNGDNNRPLNILMSYIAKSEGLSRENMKREGYTTNHDILFGYPKYEKDGKHVFGLNPENCNSEDVALTEMRKINFSLPGGLVGRQAIFSIIENLIRNAAKHGNTRAVESTNLEYTFDVVDISNWDKNQNINERIYSEKWRKLYKNASDRNNLYLLTITDNLEYKQDFINKLEPGLYEEYVDAFGKMTAGNKGLKEIRISAAWLRSETDESKYRRYIKRYNKQKKEVEEIEVVGDGLAPLVAIELTKEAHLRYMICLPQDRLAAIIMPSKMPNLKLFEQLKDSRPNDWELYNSIEDFKADIKKVFRYLIVPDQDIYNQLRPYTSNRLFVWAPINETEIEFCNKWNTIKPVLTDEEKEKLYNIRKSIIVENLYSIDSNSESIYIWDKTAYENHSTHFDKIIISKGDDNVGIAEYAYRTHHSSQKDFETYWAEKYSKDAEKKEHYKKIKSIDGITGDNSSDRLVRREPLNEEWYCSHLNSFRKKVAIFDERIFKIVHNIEETDFVLNSKANAKDEGISCYLKNLDRKRNMEDIRNEILEKNLLPIEDEDQLYELENKNDLIDFLESKVKTFQSHKSNNYKSIFYKEKGIDVFTIIKEKEGLFAVVGCVDSYAENGKPVCIYDKIASITSSNSSDSFDVSIEMHNKTFANEYDYISIHQGLLDKLYEGFNIKHPSAELKALYKDKDEQETINYCKEIVTTTLYDSFIAKTKKNVNNFISTLDKIDESDLQYTYKPIPVFRRDKENNIVLDDNQNPIKEYDYLPNFIIHSGRAKPAKEDMPQRQPFIQYSAIEHGILDCKYSLVELLDYAKFEETD